MRGLVWRGFSRTHARHQSPHMASLLNLGLVSALIVLCAAAGLDPMLQVLPWASVPSAIGVLSCQMLAALAVMAFFRRTRSDVPWARAFLAPCISAAILACLLWQMLSHVELLSGLATGPSLVLAWSVPLAGIAASALAVRLRRRSPDKFAQLSDLVRVD